ncbi:glycosyltransferase family 4 protein [Phytoactinopolyspora alkaliphila]|uniref:Glycosyltransferase family 4 protein n=1 Tax=Phytoactinopolyspora alkaliphila TaxID=1783498 RepID=A0A6N9YTP1_9ACTN|nr:glycosyltransferase family 4 protein [Phytoactinopolyspora alkaliphila]NED98335.1 glycosyltransferase family 4 protein [Phytoactinopolyspora alkaliphila]
MTERVRVAIVLSTSSGGIGRHVRSLVDRLEARGVEPHVVAPAVTGENFGFTAPASGSAPVHTPVRFSAVEILTRPRPRHDMRAVRALRRLLRDADVVHAHGFRAAALAGLALGRRRAGRTPLVATWHNAVLGSPPRRALLVGLERLAARRADVTLGASADLVERAAALGADDARLAPVAAPAMPPPSRSRAEMRAELGAADRPVVLAVGRLAPQKDYETLLAAVARWATRERQPLVVVAGDGPEMDRLRRDADNARIDVRFLGHRDDVPELLNAADVYVITSRWEARALVVQEAMRAGVPVVATAVGGLPELVGEDALLVPAADPGAVAAAVTRLLDDPGLRTELAERARLRSRQWPDEDGTADQLVRIYRELATQPSP